MEEKKFDALYDLVVGMNERMLNMDEKIQTMDNRIQGLDEKVQAMDDKIQAMDDKIQAMDDKIQTMDDKIQAMDSEIKTMKVEIQSINKTLDQHTNDIRNLQLTLENVTNKNISIIAENHIELNRKLNEALKVREEEEKLYMRMNIVENDVRKLKEKAGIA